MKKYEIQFAGHRLVMGEKTLVMGILNVTPDSFSDGGLFAETRRAVAHGIKMAQQGADIIDVGGESTRPFSDPVSEIEEISRVVPVIQELANCIDIPISIDTAKAGVAQKALEAGASIVNDISALNHDPGMGEVVAKAKAPVILMHMAGTPKTMQENPTYEDVTRQVRDFLGKAIKRALAVGIPREMIIVDPGIGFGKTISHNLLLIKKLDILTSLDVPVLVGPSRKSFIKKILENGLKKYERSPDNMDMEIGTQAVLAMAARAGAHIVRVHDVAKARVTMLLADALTQSK